MNTNLDDLAKIAFDEWQADMPLEYQMQYVPLFGEGFTLGWRAAIDCIKQESMYERFAKLEAWLEYERAGCASHGYECIGMLGVSRIWGVAINSVIDRLNEKIGDGNE